MEYIVIVMNVNITFVYTFMSPVKKSLKGAIKFKSLQTMISYMN